MGKSLSEMSLDELWELFPIILKEHNPVWKDWYVQEEKLLNNIIGDQYIDRINHIGSTSVYGLLAKPTIDILLEIKEACDLKFLMSVLEKNGYIFEKQPQKPAPHLMFMKGYTEKGFAEKVFHLHVRYIGNWNELYFRDFLRLHKDVAQEYSNLKMSLIDRYEHDRDGYTEAKTEFVNKYTKIAKTEFESKYSQNK
ncbi:GrpB family protein [Brevibacillus laterosporus]|uniref:GrpB family protein n=1 Tax=Brevibacillus laterosporus TaxID=1465 RepID=UPI001EF2DD43|nr:GrpB family protein [Brevibacillus laterosporus]MCG7318572.1 GrpB family protein [Brevibacillus laterosporus]